MTVFVLGGAQTDFARHYSRQGHRIETILADAALAALEDACVDASEIGAVHVGNFAGELFASQGLLGGLLVNALPALAGVPSARHEAACASGSVAALAAMAGIEAGYYDCALVAGVEQMRNVPGKTAAEHLGAAAWAGREAVDATYLWPAMFSRIADEYDRRHGLDAGHLRTLARAAFTHARNNPNAQTRNWTLTDRSFSEDEGHNATVEGLLRRHDCGQVTDGAAAVILCSADFAQAHARRHGRSSTEAARIEGFGHRTAALPLEDKLRASEGETYVFPELRRTLEDAWRRAGIAGVEAIDCLEAHDCFTITAYAIVDHLGLGAPGRPGEVIDAGRLGYGGDVVLNPSGGLIGAGHPVGASGVRMLLDAARQVQGRAGEMQVEGCRRAQTLNIGGSMTAVASFVVGPASGA